MGFIKNVELRDTATDYCKSLFGSLTDTRSLCSMPIDQIVNILMRMKNEEGCAKSKDSLDTLASLMKAWKTNGNDGQMQGVMSPEMPLTRGYTIPWFFQGEASDLARRLIDTVCFPVRDLGSMGLNSMIRMISDVMGELGRSRVPFKKIAISMCTAFAACVMYDVVFEPGCPFEYDTKEELTEVLERMEMSAEYADFIMSRIKTSCEERQARLTEARRVQGKLFARDSLLTMYYKKHVIEKLPPPPPKSRFSVYLQSVIDSVTDERSGRFQRLFILAIIVVAVSMWYASQRPRTTTEIPEPMIHPAFKSVGCTKAWKRVEFKGKMFDPHTKGLLESITGTGVKDDDYYPGLIMCYSQNRPQLEYFSFWIDIPGKEGEMIGQFTESWRQPEDYLQIIRR